MNTYYNEFDPDTAQWLRELMAAGEIEHGVVDERSVEKVEPSDLDGSTVCHFFAGIGGWELARQLSGWDGPIWTASLPCQPFSAAGKRLGTADHRHLWPVFRDLVAQCLPPVLVGEQIASKAGRDWLAAVQADLEALGYAVGAADLCAAGIGAPHIRQRLYWCAVRLGDPEREFSGRDAGTGAQAQGETPMRTKRDIAGASGPVDRMAHRICARLEGRAQQSAREELAATERGGYAGEAGWSRVHYLPCADGKARPIPPQPGLFPLVAGLPRGMVPSGDIGVALEEGTSEARVTRLRGYGNAIVPQVAAAFLTAVLDVLEGRA